MGHRDYLGALLSLGIERERIGGILFGEKEAYVYVLKENADYIRESLTSVGKTREGRRSKTTDFSGERHLNLDSPTSNASLDLGEHVSLKGKGKFGFLGEDGQSKKGETIALIKLAKRKKEGWGKPITSLRDLRALHLQGRLARLVRRWKSHRY